MTTKSLKERGTGRTARLAVQCAMDALKNPGTSIAVFDHDNTENPDLTYAVEKILDVIQVDYIIGVPNLITVIPLETKA